MINSKRTFLFLILTAFLIFGNSHVEAADSRASFQLKNLSGLPISTASFYGKKPLLIVFWTTWCPPCRKEIPALNQLQKTYGDKLKIIAVNAGETSAEVAKFAKKEGIQYEVLLDVKKKVATDYGVEFIPANYFYDKDGNLQFQGHLDLQKVEAVLRNS